MVGSLVRGLVNQRRVRVLAVVVHGPAQDIVQRHHLTGAAAKLAAEGVVSTLLLSAHVKGEEKLVVQVQSESPRFSFTGEARADGGLRARMRPTWVADHPLKGNMLAVKWAGRRELYRGLAALEGSWQSSLQGYLTQSQQSTGLVRLHARVDETDTVKVAAGLLVEVLGGAMDKDAFHAWSEPLRTADLNDVMTGVAFGQLLGEPIEVLEARPIEVACDASTLRGRVETMLRSLGLDELRGLLQDVGQAEVTDDFCNHTVVIDADRLRELIAELEAQQVH
jgi:molecular chaperone Hsp33